MQLHPTLNDPIWQTLEGGYRTKYDASIALKNLELASDEESAGKIINELWEELHHQGDVGTASYVALPHLIRIVKAKNIGIGAILSLCATIEQQRVLAKNPVLPQELSNFYQTGLSEMKKLALSVLAKSDLSQESLAVACSAVATTSGRVKFGKAMLELSDYSALEDFLRQF